MKWTWGIFIAGCTGCLCLTLLAFTAGLFLVAMQLGKVTPAIVSGVQTFQDVKTKVDPAFEKWDATNEQISEGVKAIRDFKLWSEAEARRRR